MNNDEFNWYDSECQADIVFPSTQGVAVYTNPNDMVVIRQQAGPTDDEDSFIIIGKQNVEAIISALQAILSED